jgi:hypothetical protein
MPMGVDELLTRLEARPREEFLKNLRAKWQESIETHGAHCPVCNRWGKIYARAINKTMAYSLIWLCSAPADEHGWVDVPNSNNMRVIRSNQLPTLRWWDLVERMATDDTSVKHSGLWRVTELGKDFVHGRVTVPEKVYTYNAEVISNSDKRISIWQCFKIQFDYQEIMNQMFPGRQQSLF